MAAKKSTLDERIERAAAEIATWPPEKLASMQLQGGGPCTCHPDDNPPNPCPRRFALSHCRAASGVPTHKVPSRDEIMAKAARWHDENTLGDEQCEHRQLELIAYVEGYSAALADGVPAGPKPMHPDCMAPDCDCEPGIECAARGAARGVAIPPAPAGWWTEELERIWNATPGQRITDNMKRAACIALRIARGERWDDEKQDWIVTDGVTGTCGGHSVCTSICEHNPNCHYKVKHAAGVKGLDDAR